MARALADGLEHPRSRRVIVVAPVAQDDYAGPLPDLRAPLIPEALQHHAVIGMTVQAHRARPAVDVTRAARHVGCRLEDAGDLLDPVDEHEAPDPGEF